MLQGDCSKLKYKAQFALALDARTKATA